MRYCETCTRRLPNSGVVKCCGIVYSTRAEPTRIGKEPEAYAQTLTRNEMYCQHRGRMVGELDCQCGGLRKVYECHKLKQLCLPHAFSKPSGKLLGQTWLASDFASCSTCEHRKPISESVFVRDETKINVGFVSTVFSEIGGVERWHETLLPNLGNNKIHVVGLACNSEFSGSPAVLGCPIQCGESGIRDLMKQCDIVVSWGIIALPESERKPRLVNVHHGQPDHQWSNNIMLETDKWCDLHVTVHGGLDSSDYIKPIVHIGNAIDPELIKPDQYWTLPPALEGKRICLWQHRLAPEKRPELLPSIAIELANCDKRWQIVVCGSGALEAVDHPLIYYAGPQAFPGRWLSVAERFLSTAEHEGFGLSCLEAMTYGVPVISAPTGICADPSLCVQVPLDATPENWAKAINGHKRDPDSVFALVSARYSLEKHVKEWRDLILEHATPNNLSTLATH